MVKKDYQFLQSYFTEPIVRGSNSSNLAQPFLQFYRRLERPDGILTIVIQTHFSVEGVGSNFHFEVICKSLFNVSGDASNIVVHDIYDMYSKAIEDIRAFLDYKIGKDGVSTIGVPIPKLEDVLTEIVEFVTLLHSQV